MAKKKVNSLAVGFCLDESGSMVSIQEVTIDGFNEYVNDLRKQGETIFSLTKFSNHRSDESPSYRPVCTAVDVKDVPELTVENYVPDGNTPLLDAIGHTVNALDEALKAAVKKPDSILFVIQTDGFENASREYTREAIFTLIQKKEKKGWKFIYLGANQDQFAAERAGQAMGMSAGSTMSYAGASTGAAFKGVSTTSAALRADPTMDSASLAKRARDVKEEEEKKKSPTK